MSATVLENSFSGRKPQEEGSEMKGTVSFQAQIYQKSLLLYLHFFSLSSKVTHPHMCKHMHAHALASEQTHTHTRHTMVCAVAMSSVTMVCGAVHTSLPGLTTMGGAGNFSNVNKNVEKEL